MWDLTRAPRVSVPKKPRLVLDPTTGFQLGSRFTDDALQNAVRHCTTLLYTATPGYILRPQKRHFGLICVSKVSLAFLTSPTREVERVNYVETIFCCNWNVSQYISDRTPTIATHHSAFAPKIVISDFCFIILGPLF